MKIAQSRGKKKKPNEKTSVFGEKIQIVEQLIGFPGLHLIQQSSIHKVFT